MVDYGELIGIPFEYGGRNPAISLDCYGLVLHIENDLKGKDMPDFGSSSDHARIAAMMQGALHLFQLAPCEEGSILLFRMARTLHVGLHLGDDRFIHTWEESGGVIIERVSDWQGRMMGSYRYVG